MSSKKSKVREFLEEYWNGRQVSSSLLGAFSDNMIFEATLGKRITKQSYLQHTLDWIETFPDFRMNVELAEEVGSSVMVAVECVGTFAKPFVDHEADEGHIIGNSAFHSEFKNAIPNNKEIRVRRNAIFIFGKDKIERLVSYVDESDFKRQLGIAPGKDSGLAERDQLAKEFLAILNVGFSERELECLAFTLSGFSAKYVGELLKISYRTVEAHLYKAYQKLDCYGKQQCLEMMHAKEALHLWWEYSRLLLHPES